MAHIIGRLLTGSLKIHPTSEASELTLASSMKLSLETVENDVVVKVSVFLWRSLTGRDIIIAFQHTKYFDSPAQES